MGGRIAQGLDLIPTPGDHLSFTDHNSADRHLLGSIGLVCLSQGLPHEVGIACKVNDRFVPHGNEASTRRGPAKPRNRLPR